MFEAFVIFILYIFVDCKLQFSGFYFAEQFYVSSKSKIRAIWARRLVDSDMRLKTKDSRFESGC